MILNQYYGPTSISTLAPNSRSNLMSSVLLVTAAQCRAVRPPALLSTWEHTSSHKGRLTHNILYGLLGIDGVWTIRDGVWTIRDGVWTIRDGVWTIRDGVWSIRDGVCDKLSTQRRKQKCTRISPWKKKVLSPFQVISRLIKLHVVVL